MTTPDHSPQVGARPEPWPDGELVHGQQLPLQSDQDYRQLEQHYCRSAQYAAMVSRYPCCAIGFMPAATASWWQTLCQAQSSRASQGSCCSGTAVTGRAELNA
jgi:hypothetical protein